MANNQTAIYEIGAGSNCLNCETVAFTLTYNPALYTALNNFTSGVNGIVREGFDVSQNKLFVKLVTPYSPALIQIINNIVVTTNTALNNVFANHNVYQYYAGNNYSFANCNCNIFDLQTDLNNLPSIIQSADLDTCFISVLVTNNDFEINKVKIAPNPFQDCLQITSDENIISYELVDISGKQIINTPNKINFQNQLKQVNKGMYMLNLRSENIKNFTQKLIKN